MRPKFSMTALLRADRLCRTTAQVATVLGCTPATVRNARNRFRAKGAKFPKRKAGRPRHDR